MNMHLFLKTNSQVKSIGGVLFGVAIIVAAARTILRLRTAPRLGLDDALLLLTCVWLVASTAVFYKLAPGIYLFEEAISNPSDLELPSDAPTLVVENIKLVDSYNVASWLVIYTVKLCFLSFLRSLIDRVRGLVIYWKVIVGLTIVFFGVSVCEAFIACPQFTLLSGIFFYPRLSE